MLALDPARRISMKEALKHPYFDDLSMEDKSKYQQWLIQIYPHYIYLKYRNFQKMQRKFSKRQSNYKK